MVTEISELKELGSCRSAEAADGLREFTDYLTLYINMRVPLAERIIIEPNENGYVCAILAITKLQNLIYLTMKY